MERWYHDSVAWSGAKTDSTVRTGAPKARGLPVSVPVAYLAHMLQRTFPAGFIAPCGCIPQSLWWRMLDLSGKPDAPAVKREAEDWGK